MGHKRLSRKVRPLHVQAPGGGGVLGDQWPRGQAQTARAVALLSGSCSEVGTMPSEDYSCLVAKGLVIVASPPRPAL
jgi:hypothetical protein